MGARTTDFKDSERKKERKVARRVSGEGREEGEGETVAGPETREKGQRRRRRGKCGSEGKGKGKKFGVADVMRMDLKNILH